jgi:hypothetical protein
MELKKEKIGIKVKIPTLERWVIVNEKNKELLLSSGLFQFFIANKKLKPIKNDSNFKSKKEEHNSGNSDRESKGK